MKSKVKLKGKILFILVFLLCLVISTAMVLYINIHGLNKNLTTRLIGKETITLEVGDKYQDKGIDAKYKKLSVKNIKTKGKVNTKKIGSYQITYNVKYKMLNKKLTRKIKVVDTTKPEIKLNGDTVNIVVGSTYTDPGYSAIDNYDGNISEKVKVTNNIDKNTIGTYEVKYQVADSSKNEAVATRVVNVIALPKTDQKIAVLNYHFFYDPDKGEDCGDGNCKRVADFRKELDYLKNNNYKTLTMKEFRDWMYGILELPEKSVLITIDDGAKGTGAHNGNKLIPILEEYKMHATLFLITGWWGIENYQSEYLDIESHTNDMHNEGWCSGVTRGARMLCQSNEEVLNDLKTSISITGSKLGFCFPFYAYNDNAISLVKQAGFELAFIGGGYKATRQTDKYKIPRYQIKQDTSLDTFIKYVS